MKLPIGVVTVSDSVSRGASVDRGGPAVQEWLRSAIVTPWAAVARVVPDEIPAITRAVEELCDTERCPLVITTGGTGPAPRDVTPEATEAVCSRLLPGFGEAMRAASVATVPTAILSRQTAGIRGSSLVINVPGNPSAVADCLAAVFAAVPDAVELIGGPRLETNPEVVAAFSPRHRRQAPAPATGSPSTATSRRR